MGNVKGEAIKGGVSAKKGVTTKVARGAARIVVDKKSKKMISLAILVMGILSVLLVIYFGFALYFRNHFYFRSTINGAPSSGKTVSQMVDQLNENAQGYTLTITNGSSVKSYTREQLGMQASITDKEVTAVLKQQAGYDWPIRVLLGADFKSSALVSVSDENVANIANEYAAEVGGEESVAADVVEEGGKYVIRDEVYGTQIDAAKLTEKIKTTAIAFEDVIEVETAEVYILPRFTSKSEEVKNYRDKIEKISKMTIVYDMGTKTETIESDEIKSWVGHDGDMNLTFDDDALTAHVNRMKGKHETVGDERSLVTQYGVTVTVPVGNYGWRIDREGEINQLKAEIDAGESVTRDFIYSATAASREGNDYGNSYVEINRTAQTVFLIINGQKVLEAKCVTGRDDGVHATPVGAYRITYCERNATLTGEDYSTPVSYWMPFNGDIGLHDATWQRAFGGQRYRQGYGSHGCVNLPLSAAQTIFENVETGFPVLMYDLAGTESEDTLGGGGVDAEVTACINAIEAIGVIDVTSYERINAARALYDALPEEKRAAVTNIQTLIDAEWTYANTIF